MIDKQLSRMKSAKLTAIQMNDLVDLESDQKINLQDEKALRRSQTLNSTKTLGKTFDEDFNLHEHQMKLFVEKGIKKRFISSKPKRQQLYFIYKLILNRTKFNLSNRNWLLLCLCKAFTCCRKKYNSNRLQQRLSLAGK